MTWSVIWLDANPLSWLPSTLFFTPFQCFSQGLSAKCNWNELLIKTLTTSVERSDVEEQKPSFSGSTMSTDWPHFKTPQPWDHSGWMLQLFFHDLTNISTFLLVLSVGVGSNTGSLLDVGACVQTVQQNAGMEIMALSYFNFLFKTKIPCLQGEPQGLTSLIPLFQPPPSQTQQQQRLKQ